MRLNHCCGSFSCIENSEYQHASSLGLHVRDIINNTSGWL
jgi:hypothetical protein